METWSGDSSAGSVILRFDFVGLGCLYWYFVEIARVKLCWVFVHWVLGAFVLRCMLYSFFVQHPLASGRIA